MPISAVLAERIDVLERAYEYMLAYAGLDRESDTDGQPTEIRAYLKQADAALGDLAKLPLSALGVGDSPPDRATYDAFLDVLRADAQKSRDAIGLALMQPVISSRLVDNLNALVHIRAVLTDLFVIDDALKPVA